MLIILINIRTMKCVVILQQGWQIFIRNSGFVGSGRSMMSVVESRRLYCALRQEAGVAAVLIAIQASSASITLSTE
jgi:hypothetical protein